MFATPKINTALENNDGKSFRIAISRANAAYKNENSIAGKIRANVS